MGESGTQYYVYSTSTIRLNTKHQYIKKEISKNLQIFSFLLPVLFCRSQVVYNKAWYFYNLKIYFSLKIGLKSGLKF